MELLVLVLGTALAITAYFVLMRRFADENKRLPPFSTPEGKKARIAGIPVLLLFLGILVYYLYSLRHNAADLSVAVSALFASTVYTAFMIYRKTKGQVKDSSGRAKRANPNGRSPKAVFSKISRLTGWRAVLVIFVVIGVPYIVFSLIIVPRMGTWVKSWMESRLPEMHSLQPVLQSEFPDKEVFVFDQTYYGSGSEGKRRVLGIAIVGKSFVSRDQAVNVRTVVCSELGNDRKKYDAIVLQSTIEKRFLIFFSRQNKAGKIDCDAPIEAPPAIADTPDVFKDGNFQLLPDPDSDTFMPGDTLNIGTLPETGKDRPVEDGNFQLQGPASYEKYTPEYKKAFLAACTADRENTYDACGCSLESLMYAYTYDGALALSSKGFPEELVSRWNSECYLSADGFDAKAIKLQP